MAGDHALSLRLFGDLEVRRDGELLPLPQSKKTRALLAFLVVTGRPHRRDRLCSLFWDIPDDPRGALRWSLSKLRPLVDEAKHPRVIADRKTVAFDPAGASVDLFAVRWLLDGGLGGISTAQLRAAAESIDGEFLADLDLPDLYEYQAWLVAERDETRALQLALLAALADRLAATPDDALPYARMAAELDPDDDGARATLETVRAARAAQRQQTEPAAAAAAVAARPEPGQTLTDKPSIAILPFVNMSGDPAQEYFSDGIADDIITALSRFRWFSVTARNSSFSFNRQAVDVRQVAGELGVRYVLEGSVRKAGNRVRVTVQLIDATTGHHIWAERYDRELEDIFAVQDEITQSIIASLAPEFMSAEVKRAQRADTRDLSTWELIMRARWHTTKFEQAHNAEAQRLLHKAIDLDRENAFAHSNLAFSHIYDALYGWGDSVADSIERADDAARQAVVIDDRDAWAQSILGRVELLRNRHDNSINRLTRAITLNPNLAYAYGQMGLSLGLAGQYEQAVDQINEAIRLSPRDPMMAVWMATLSIMSFYAGKFDAAADWADRAAQENPDLPISYRLQAAAYGQLGRAAEAAKAIKTLLTMQPGLTLATAADQVPPTKDPADKKRYLDALRKAGLPE